MFNLPRVRVELEGMKFQIIHAFSSHNDDIEKLVEKEISKAIENYPFEEEVSRLANEILTKAIEETLKEYLIYGDGKKALRGVIDEKLNRIFEG